MMDQADIFTSVLQILVASYYLFRALYSDDKETKAIHFALSLAFILVFFLTLAVGMSR
jgi:hypothetical protein